MFINRDEAERRIKNSSRILNTVKKGNGSHTSETPATDTSKDKQDFSDEVSEQKLKELLNVTPRGRGKEMSTRERADLAVTSLLVGSPAAGAMLDRGPKTAQPLREGYLSTDKWSQGETHRDQELVNELNRQKKEVRDLAFDRITSAVGLITHEKLEKVTDVVKLARVSRDLITVVDKTLPKDEAQNNSIHFHLWKPEMKEESHYEVINVNSPK